MTESYPLQWPVGRPRITSPAKSKFKQTGWDSTKTLLAELRRLGCTNVVISTNVELRNDGLPYANRKQPQDKGVAVYYTHRKKAMCFACDKWDTVGDNIYAIAKTIEALRGISRWGTGDMVEQAFSGFTALPAPKAKVYESWWVVMGLEAHTPTEKVTERYRYLARRWHPDNGGDHDDMAKLNQAYDDFKKERGL